MGPSTPAQRVFRSLGACQAGKDGADAGASPGAVTHRLLAPPGWAAQPSPERERCGEAFAAVNKGGQPQRFRSQPVASGRAAAEAQEIEAIVGCGLWSSASARRRRGQIGGQQRRRSQMSLPRGRDPAGSIASPPTTDCGRPERDTVLAAAGAYRGAPGRTATLEQGMGKGRCPLRDLRTWGFGKRPAS
jgi:hypothetical protein